MIQFKMFFKKRFILSLILLIVVVAFSPSLFNGFVKNDDPYHLLENVTLRALTFENLRAMFQSIINTTYIPLTTLSFAIEYHFFDYQPFIYHFDNLLLHLGVVVLVFLFLQQLGLSLVAASWATLLFGLHPMKVESVAWVTERKDVLYAFFYMLSLWHYMKYAQTGRRQNYLWSLLNGGMSVLAKSMAISLPLIFLLCDLWVGRKLKRTVWLEKIPFFLIVGLVAGVTYAYNVRNPIHSWMEAPLLWIWCLIFYLWKFIFPWNLCIFYQFPKPISWTNPQLTIAVGLFVLLIFALIYFRRYRLWLFAMTFYFFSIFFLLRMDDLENINPVSDRFMYLPSLGFCALLGVGLEHLLNSSAKAIKQKPFGFIIPFGIVILWAGITFNQCRAWGDGAGLWSKVIQQSPTLAMAYVHRGSEYHLKGDVALAKADYLTAIKLKNDPYAHSNLAMIYKEQNQFAAAVEEYSCAIAIKPDFWGAYFDRGNLYREQGDLTRAIADYTRALQLLPGYAEAYGNRGLAYFLNRLDDLALEDFTWAIRFNSREINALNNRAVIYAQRGHYQAAITDFTRSLQLDPNNPAIYYNRGLAFQESHRYDLAIGDFNQALRLKPDYQEARRKKAEIQASAYGK